MGSLTGSDPANKWATRLVYSLSLKLLRKDFWQAMDGIANKDGEILRFVFFLITQALFNVQDTLILRQ